MKTDLDIFVENNRNRVRIIEYIRDKSGIVYKGIEHSYVLKEQTGISERKNVENRCNELRKEKMFLNIPQED